MGERCVEFYNGWVLKVEEPMTIQVSDPRHHDMLDISVKAETFDSTGYRSDQVNAEIAELSFEKHTLSFDFIDDYSDVLFRHYIDCLTGLRFQTITMGAICTWMGVHVKITPLRPEWRSFTWTMALRRYY